MAIAELDIGDMVLATDPTTGETGPRAVTDLFVHDDAFVELTVDGAVLVTTDDHPFWNVTDHQWQPADQLDIGDQLLTAEGHTAAVEAYRDAGHSGDAYNFTVADLHTYYVEAGDHTLLVHNTCGPALGSGNAYSVAFETRLSSNSYPGMTRGDHFREANQNLLRAMDADAGFAAAIDEMIPGIRGQLQRPNSTSNRPSALWTWHDAPEPGVMQLVPRVQHTAPGNLQQLFHPGGRGGWAIWGPR